MKLPTGAVLDRLRRRDPGYRVTRRAARLTLIASLTFYVCRYGVGNTVLTTYALFGIVATGTFAQLPGRAAERARTLLAALPVAWLLVAVGTVLAVRTWAAAAGMLVIGFAVAFAGVGGPRLVGLANAFQLFYILACFPPYQPDTLAARLAGVTLGIVLVALAEATLWPDPPPVTFRRRLADAAGGLADYLEGVAGVLAGSPDAEQESTRRHHQVLRAVEQIRMPRLPVTVRPTSASRRDRALRDAAGAVRELLALTESLAAEAGRRDVTDDDLARLLRRCAGSIRQSGRTTPRGAPAATGPDVAATAAGNGRRWRSGDGALLRLDAIAQTLVEQVEAFGTAVRLAGGPPGRQVSGRPEARTDQFWYARRSTLSLYWRQCRAHLTPRSVYFEGALRLAVALTAARVIAGVVDLQHGFWVLLATLSLMRTSAADTRTTLPPALAGTLLGAAGGGLLLLASPAQEAYAAMLPLIMVLAFGVGPLLGLAWSQVMLTLLLIVIFAQLSPASWQLAAARVVDVAIGAAVGVLAGLLLWPRGGSGELRRDTGAYLAAGARAVEETVGVLAGRAGARGAVEAARRAKVLADASFAQYHVERHDPRMSQVNWDSLLSTGNRMVHGAEALLSHNRPGVLVPWADPAAQLVGWAGRLRSGYAGLARQVSQGSIDRPPAAPAPAPDVIEQVRTIVQSGETRPDVRSLVEVDVWLADLTGHLDRVQSPPGGDAEGTDPSPASGYSPER